MPPQNTQEPQQPIAVESTAPVTHARKGFWVTMILVVAALLGAYAYVYYMYVVPARTATLDQIMPTELIASKRSGDYQTALQIAEEIAADPLKSANEQALAVFNAGKLRFKLSGNINELLVDIQNLKDIILDETLSQQIRVRALNTLQSSYCSSGRDPLAFEEIYKDEPFRQYLAAGDPDLSALNLAKWSYETFPTAFAAVRIARWHGDQIVNDANLTAVQKEEYAETVRKYLKSGEALIGGELQRHPDYINSAEYAGYLFWRARGYGRLAIYGDQWYKDRYQQTFTDVIDFVEKQNNVESNDDQYFAYQYLAQFSMVVEKDKVTAKAALDALSAKLDALENPVVVTFVRFIRNEYKNRPEGGSWQGILKMTRISPAYKATVEKMLTLPPSVMRSEGLGTVINATNTQAQ